MYNEQLNFNQNQYNDIDNDNNYYTFNGNKNEPITEEIYNRMQRERIQAIIENEAFKEKYLQQQSNLIQNEQLDYISNNTNQPEENPMLYSFGKPSYNKQIPKGTKQKSKVTIKNKGKLILPKKKPVIQKKNKIVNELCGEIVGNIIKASLAKDSFDNVSCVVIAINLNTINPN